MDPRVLIAKRAAQELKDGQLVNLGFGMPTQASNYLPEGVKVMFHAENGVFGVGPRPKASEAKADMTNAGSEPVTLAPGAAIMDLATSLGAMRSGLLDVTILGALEVDQLGNIANWAVLRNGKWWPGIGGAMDLCYGTKTVIACLMHTDKDGASKVLKQCTLPLTGKGCVKTIITDKAVFDVGEGRLILKEHAPGVTLDEIRTSTEADFEVAEDFCEMKL
ncbi:MAG TPA: succinyl-CoA--3-ketoacid-CoA transferase [Sporomusaceae bacterium]|jgi:3-oxoacid CoA-transferase B subunit|uniref:3-oxoacid CoA-transferase subunit B n=1 Tax=Anaerospora sp. TaxID=1960278 RepID=UPI000EEDD35A|nr:3-oxoacid CoA-transferase subunit B [Anaerospora sp.]HAK75100.1 succinyl-CoA--3-ketoacid-CoA transferase [Sporomusaceae bacterium]